MHKPRILASRKGLLRKSDLPKQESNTEVKAPENVKEIVVYVCSICQALSLSSKAVAVHMLHAHKNVKDVRSILQRSSNFDSEQSRLSKKVRKYKKEYNCQICSYSTIHMTCFKRHVGTHQNGMKYKCPHCSHTSLQLYNIKRHITNIHPEFVVTSFVNNAKKIN